MKKLLILCTAVLFCCQSPQPEQSEEDTGNVEVSSRADEYKQAFDQLYNALMASDSAGAAAAVSADFLSYYMFSDIDTVDLQTEIQNWIDVGTRRLNQSIETIAYTALTVKEGDYVGDWLQVWGMYSATEAGVDLSNPFFANARMRDGKPAEMILYFDRLGYYQKLGFELTAQEGN